MPDQTDRLTPTERLRFDILGGAFAPGERLPEVSLAERYAVGRGSIRSALVELRAEGLVDIEANRGAMVRRIGLDEAIEIAEARKVLEGLIAGRAALSDDIGAKESLHRIVDQMRDAVAAKDNSRYSELNRELHRRIWEIGRHRVANDLVAKLRDRSAHHQFRLAVMPGRAEESLGQHAAVVDAIVAGDADGARRAMEHHLDSVIEVLSEWSELGAP
ncbi:MAG TPA: GntR family transcriptional regulator [Acidimicrobiia bacterium]|nr:GntR family transcriptional regulator [Acidimicrobiia bacterium]